MPERDEAKVSRHVLWGRWLSNGLLLPDRYQQRVIHHLTQRARKLGLQLIPLPQQA